MHHEHRDDWGGAEGMPADGVAMKTPGEFEAFIQVHGEINRLAFHVDERDREHRSAQRARDGEYEKYIDEMAERERTLASEHAAAQATIGQLRAAVKSYEDANAEHRAELAKLSSDNDAMSKRFMAKCADFDAQLVEIDRLKGELAEPPICYSIDCRYYGQRHATPHESREGEPGTHICPNDYGGPCFHASHKKGAKP